MEWGVRLNEFGPVDGQHAGGAPEGWEIGLRRWQIGGNGGKSLRGAGKSLNKRPRKRV